MPKKLYRALIQSAFLFFFIFIHLLFIPHAYSHPGGLDKNCGHKNRKTGEYHYHLKKCKPKSSKKATKSLESIVEGKVMKVKDGDTIVISPLSGGQFLHADSMG